MVSFTTLLALSATALASPVLQARQRNLPADWAWHVSGWEAGCSRSGCYYNFNVTIPSVEGQVGGAKAYCRGDENGWYMKGNWFQQCQILEGVNSSVAAKLSERTVNETSSPSPKEILISLELAGSVDKPTYNFTGSHETIYNQAVAPLQEFDVKPTEVWGIF